MGLQPGLTCCIANTWFNSALTYPLQGDHHDEQKSPRDKQPPLSGKVENATKNQGEQAPTQLNQGQRTADSRSDREGHVGGSNQSQSRRGPVGAPKRLLAESGSPAHFGELGSGAAAIEIGATLPAN